MSNQLRLLPTEADPRTEPSRPRRRRQAGPSAPVGRISTRTRRAGRRGIAEARQALEAAAGGPEGEAELRRAG